MNRLEIYVNPVSQYNTIQNKDIFFFIYKTSNDHMYKVWELILM